MFVKPRWQTLLEIAGLIACRLRTAVLFDSSDGLHKKTPNPEIGSFFMTRTGIEPMLQP